MTWRAASIAVASALCLATSATGQETTERFIPIGESPGVSGVMSDVGTVAAVDEQGRTITIRLADGAERTVGVTDETRIWLDRSRLLETNTIGDLSDLTVGRTVEVKYVEVETRAAADWIKVRIERGG